VSRIDPAPYLAYFRERARRAAAARTEALARARAAVPAAALTLRARGARRIWLIGSLPRGTFETSSDLDFMTEGLDEPGARAAARDISDLTGLPADVLRAEDMDPAWREHNARFGELLDVT
jgi:predicted nucleotidyltransferase